MKKSLLGLMVGIVFFFWNTHVVKSEGISIKTGYITGNGYFNVTQRDEYLIGLVDGLLLAPMFGASKKKMKWFEDCITEMPNTQLRAIVDKFMNDNPDKWKNPMQILAYQSLYRSCPNSSYKKK
jgi:hypothetical protein